MNAMEARKLCNCLTTNETVLDQLNDIIHDEAFDGKRQTIARINVHHNRDKVVKALRDNGFLVKCTLFTLNDHFFYEYDINWEQYNNEEQNNKLAQQYS